VQRQFTFLTRLNLRVDTLCQLQDTKVNPLTISSNLRETSTTENKENDLNSEIPDFDDNITNFLLMRDSQMESFVTMVTDINNTNSTTCSHGDVNNNVAHANSNVAHVNNSVTHVNNSSTCKQQCSTCKRQCSTCKQQCSTYKQQCSTCKQQCSTLNNNVT